MYLVLTKLGPRFGQIFGRCYYLLFDIVLIKFDYIEVLVYLIMLCSVMLFEFV